MVVERIGKNPICQAKKFSLCSAAKSGGYGQNTQRSQQ